MRVRIGGAICTALVLCLVAGLTSASSGSEGRGLETSAEADSTPNHLEAVAKALGISQAEAKARLSREPAVAALQAKAAAVLGESFAGVWVDHASGGSINLGVSQSGIHLLPEVVAGFPYPELLSMHLTERTLADLGRVQQRISQVPLEIRS